MCTYPPIPLSSCVHAFIDPFMVQKSTPWLRDIGGSDSLMTWTLGLKNRWYLRWSRLRFIFQVYTIHITIYIYCNYYFNYQHLIYTYIYNIVITKYFKNCGRIIQYMSTLMIEAPQHRHGGGPQNRGVSNCWKATGESGKAGKKSRIYCVLNSFCHVYFCNYICICWYRFNLGHAKMD